MSIETQSNADAKRKRKRQVDPRALKIESSVPLPPRANQRGSSRWLPVFQEMKVGDSVLVPNTTVVKMAYVRKRAREIGIYAVARPEGTGVRVWRVLDENGALPPGVPGNDDGLDG